MKEQDRNGQAGCLAAAIYECVRPGGLYRWSFRFANWCWVDDEKWPRFHPADLQNLKFKLDFKGTTYGIGTTLVGGVGNWFTAVDANYTQTQFDILDGSIDAFTVSPRVGYRFTTPGIDKMHLPSGKLNVWVGSMYQDVQQEFKGSLDDLTMPSATLQRLVSMANYNNNGRFDVKQHLQSPWNMLLGAQYEITRHFNVTTEFGFAERNSFFVAGEYRF